MGLKNLFEKYERHFEPGGKLEKYYVLYEAVATIFILRAQSHAGVRMFVTVLT